MAEYLERHVTLTHHLLDQEAHHPEWRGDFVILLNAIETACKFVSSKVRAAGLFNLYGAQGHTNATGDTVQKIDVLANNAFITSLSRSHKDEELIRVESKEGNYVAVFDPLDGSSNIDVNISIGSIFGIYKRRTAPGPAQLEDVLQPGSALLAAGYVMYGSATLAVLATSNGPVNGFTLDPSLGDFILTHPKIQMKKRGVIYSINEGNSIYWDQATKKYVESVKNPGEGKKPYSLRYVGSMVADVHRTLLYGGIFMYPGDRNAKEGKLRLLYEANPMALLCERAGGAASTGKGRIMELTPTSVHQRTPVFLGSAENIADLEKFYKENA